MLNSGVLQAKPRFDYKASRSGGVQINFYHQGILNIPFYSSFVHDSTIILGK